jgi:hypothetical protein
MKKHYRYECSKNGNKSALDMVKWMRSNFGERGTGWDFRYSAGSNTLDIWCWESKHIFAMELIM